MIREGLMDIGPLLQGWASPVHNANAIAIYSVCRSQDPHGHDDMPAEKACSRRMGELDGGPAVSCAVFAEEAFREQTRCAKSIRWAVRMKDADMERGFSGFHESGQHLW